MRACLPRAAVVGLGSLLACGGETTAALRDAAATTEDVGAALDAGLDASCADLEDAAQASFARVAAQYLACQVDTDCTWTFFGSDGWCIAPCGVIADEAGVGAVASSAANLCETFNARGCPAPEVPCVAGPPLICAGGTCAAYDLYATQLSPSLVHSECASFQVSYRTFAGSPEAPHDIVVTLKAGGGALYADGACATLLEAGTVTIPAGSHVASFGFEPQIAGRCAIYVDGIISTWTAQ
jgi:hypothetical protein